MLHEVLGNEFLVERVSLYDAEQYSPEYLLKNPNHCVPTLEITTDNDVTISIGESGAMVSLLADTFPEKKLAPPASEMSHARADYLHMLHFGSTWVDMMLWQIRVNEHLVPKAEQDQATILRYRNKFTKEAEPQIISRLQQSDFICGDDFSAADCIMGHNVMWAKAYRLCEQEIFSAYLSRLSKRPAFLQAFADAGEFSVEIPQDKAVAGMFTG